jgi:Ca2+-binding RTX toxin-like protein
MSDQHLTGTEQDDVLAGAEGNDWLEGFGGSDVLSGGEGNDLMEGGAGDDTYHFTSGSDVINDAADATGGNRLLLTSWSYVHPRLSYTSGYLVLDLPDGHTVRLSGFDPRNALGSRAIETFQFSDGVLTYDQLLTRSIIGFEIRGTDDPAGNILEGTNLVDHIYGGAGDDLVYGHEGDDTLYGHAGNDTLHGGTGRDLLLGGTGDDLLGGDPGNDTLAGGSGSDTYILERGMGADTALDRALGDFAPVDTVLVAANIAPSDLIVRYDPRSTSVSLYDAGFVLGITGTTDSLKLVWAPFPDQSSPSTESDYEIEQVVFADGTIWDEAILMAKALQSTPANDEINGFPFDDVISGGDGNDTLHGHGGNDRLNGGVGGDTLFGNDGNDYLDGGPNFDQLIGGKGDDEYIVSAPTDAVTELPSEGVDSVYSAAFDFTLPFDVENLTLIEGSAATRGSGNHLSNVIIGNSRNNQLVGGAGASPDILAGGRGDDLYRTNEHSSVIEAPNEGIDTIEVQGTYALPDNVENLIITGNASYSATGNSASNTISGNAGSNVLDGGAGADTMIGGPGDDVFVVDDPGDVVVENPDEGTDRVESSISYALGPNVENLTLTGAAAIDGTGNELANVMIGNSANNLLYSDLGDDTLKGGAGSDELSAGPGNDYLDGEAGVDFLYGGLGDDTYLVDECSDVIWELYGQGLDTVYSSAFEYTLPFAIENLTLTGDALRGTGNEHTNIIIGTAADNILNGGYDDQFTFDRDVMYGGAGNDTYVAGISDTVVEAANEGIDTIESLGTYFLLPENVENLTLIGFASNGTGNSADNVLIGNALANILDGGAGIDIMRGGLGDDQYLVDNANDMIVENPLEGIDTVESPFDYTLDADSNIENLTLTGIAVRGTGNDFGNTIAGNAADNVLDGRAGDDTFDISFGGRDIVIGGEGSDTVVARALSLDAADTIDGGAGNDVLIIDNSIFGGTVIFEESTVTNVETFQILGGGFSISTLKTHDGTVAAGETLTVDLSRGSGLATFDGSAETDGRFVLIGSHILIGGAGADFLKSNGGRTFLDGGAGADLMVGSISDNTYVVDNPGDQVVEAESWHGTDLVLSSIDYVLTQHVDDLTLTGTAELSGRGTDMWNVLVGNAAANRLYGEAREDVLEGAGGNDLLHGGLDRDAARYSGNSAGYAVVTSGDAVRVVDLDMSDGDEGTDTLEAIERLRFQDGELSFSPDVRVNTSTGAFAYVPGIASLGSAGHVIVWTGAGMGDDVGIFQRRYDVNGKALGVETRVSTNVVNQQFTQSVAALSGGGYVVAWSSLGQDGSMGGIYTQRFDTAGNRVGVETRANTHTALEQLEPTVAGLPDGGYLVAWQSNQQDGSAYGVYLQRYDANGAAVGPETRVNSTAAGEQYGPEIAVLSDGGYVVVWTTIGQDGDLYGVYLQRFDAAGNAVGGETLATNTTRDFQWFPSVAALADGNFVVAWINYAAFNGGTMDAYARRFNQDATPIGDEFKVNTGLPSNVSRSAITALADGGFVIAYGTMGQRFAADGSRVGGEFQYVGEYDGSSPNPAVAALADGGYAITWAGHELYARRYGADGVAKVDYFELRGTAGNDVLNALDGDQTIIGGAGDDTMSAGAGDDRYVVDQAGDVIVEAAGEGNDTVESSVSHALAPNVENIVLTGSAAINGAGNELANVLIGNSAANVLAGGAGDDMYVVDSPADQIVENFGEGVDTVQSAVSYTLGANLENLTLTGTGVINATGNNLDNVLRGNASGNTLIGGPGNDTYYISGLSDDAVENAGEGTDTVVSPESYTLSTNLENLVLADGALSGTGNASANNITGNAGDNFIDGLAGADTLAGGLGNDTYVVDSLGDSVIEQAGEGTDSVLSSVSWTLGANFENLTLTGTAAINGTGNALDNVLTGNSASNVLSGGTGNDVYHIQSSGDSTLENFGEGIDTVHSAVTRTLGANLEHLVLTGSGAINGTGNGGENLLRGNSAGNTLNGGAGFDALEGLVGDDTLTDTSASPAGNYFNGGNGMDKVTAGDAWDFILGGSGNDTITSGRGPDVIAFNIEDGQDTLNASGRRDDVLSLGGAGLTYAGLSFEKSGSNLLLNVGPDRITFKSWYGGSNNKDILTLQVIAEAMVAFDSGSSNPLLNRKVQTFNFAGLVSSFDAARAATPGLTTWALSNALNQWHLGGSDSEAYGGDLAYHYGKSGSLAGVGFDKAKETVTGSFGSSPQPLHDLPSLQEGVMRLS